jgi:serine protease Do
MQLTPSNRRWIAPARFTLALTVCFCTGLVARALDRPTSPVAKAVPEGVAELKAIQEKVRKVVDKVLPCTVCVRMGAGQGSGIIISADGYILTAGHVSGAADREATIIFASGRKVKGKTLGGNRKIDSGLVKITEEGPWPFVDMGQSALLQPGQWCVAIGHPGGYRKDRPPVVRLGRILNASKDSIQTDCTLVGGDSGGPLLDLEGKVIGIHSRIGNSIAANIHVPVDIFSESWDRLVSGEVWGGRFPGKTASEPYLGVRGDTEAVECKIGEVIPDSPAEAAGLMADDVVLGFAGKKVATFEDLTALVQTRSPGDKIELEVRRNGEIVTLHAVIGKRPERDE